MYDDNTNTTSYIDEIPIILLYLSAFGLSELFVRVYLNNQPFVEFIYHICLLILFYFAHITIKTYKQNRSAFELY